MEKENCMQNQCDNDVGVDPESLHELLANIQIQPSLPSLPPEILLQIFADLDGKSLLSCRLTCNLWNNLVLNEPSLMRKMTFSIDDFGSFEMSSIASKVKSIKISHEYTGHFTHLRTIFSTLGIEKVVLSFLSHYNVFSSNAYEIFSAVVSTCSTLEELEIADLYPRYLRELTPEEVITCGSKIKKLILNIENLQSNVVTHKFLLSFPKLSYLKSRTRLMFFDVISKHTMKFPGALKVVEWNGNYRRHCLPAATSAAFYKFIVTAQRRGVDFYVDFDIRASLNDLLSHIERGGDPLTEKHYQLITDGGLVFYSRMPHDTQQLDRFKKLTNLEIDFRHVPPSQKLHFLCNMQNLRKLVLKARFQSTIEFPEEVLSVRYPSLEGLMTKFGDFFRKTDFILFPQVFPNLRMLALSGQERIPEDLFCLLAKIETLEIIRLEEFSRCKTDEGVDTSGLTDNIFTKPSELTWNGNEKRIVPAVGSFRSLKRLCIFDANRLTDAALTDGIALADSINDVVIRFKSGQFSSNAINAIGQGRSVELVEALDMFVGDFSQVTAKLL